MIISQRDLFCDSVDVSAAAGTALRGDVKPLGTARDIGQGQITYLIIKVTTAFASAGSATVDIKLASDDTASISTSTSTIHLTTGVKAYTELAAGATFVFALPAEGSAYEDFLGILVTTAGATTTAGAISAFLSPDPVGWKAYAEGVS